MVLENPQVSLKDTLTIPEQGLYFHPERYYIVDVFETKIRSGGPLSIPNKPVQAALLMPKIPGMGEHTTGFQMHLTEVENGVLSSIAGNTVHLESYGYQGLCVAMFSQVWLFNRDHPSQQDYRRLGFGKRIDRLENVVGKQLGVIYNAVKNNKQEDLEKAAKEIAPELIKFFDLYPDVVTPHYLKQLATETWRDIRYGNPLKDFKKK